MDISTPSALGDDSEAAPQPAVASISNAAAPERAVEPKAPASAPDVDSVVERVARKMAARAAESDAKPVAEAPVEEAPAEETQPVESPVVDAPKVDAPQLDTPIDTHAVETARAEAPAEEAPAAEEVAIEEPAQAAQEPLHEAQLEDAPIVDLPPAPVADESPEPTVASETPVPSTNGQGGFRALGVDPAIAAVLEAQGITEPFPIQTLTIPDALDGKNVCGKARTGSGKTLAFGLPIVQRAVKHPKGHPYGLILTPTRELARQVADVIGELAAGKGLVAEAFYGGTSLGKDLKTLRRGVDIVIGTPGRLIDLTERGELHLETVRMVVLDEADRMCDMGFMPQVETLFSSLRDRDQTLLFSATLDGAVDVLVKIYMRDPVFHDVVDDTVDIDSMTHHFLMVERLDRAAVVASIIRGAKRPLVFTRTKRDADRLVDSLKKLDIRAQAIHGDRRQESREKALDDFSRGKLPVLVATDVAARGIHIEGVDIVIHYDPPQDPKAYVHRSGRTARAGETGVVVTLSSIDQRFDLWLLQREIGVKADAKPVKSDDPMLGTLATY